MRKLLPVLTRSSLSVLLVLVSVLVACAQTDTCNVHGTIVPCGSSSCPCPTPAPVVGGQSGGSIDMTGAIGSVLTDLHDAVTANGLALLGCMLVFVVFVYIWRRARRSVS